VIALAAEINLSASDAEEFQNKIAETFQLMVSLGGQDVDPQLYNEKMYMLGIQMPSMIIWN
jgi:gamma-glutamyl-gamma-aminobutyrate hydrolase PuuD